MCSLTFHIEICISFLKHGISHVRCSKHECTGFCNNHELRGKYGKTMLCYLQEDLLIECLQCCKLCSFSEHTSNLESIESKVIPYNIIYAEFRDILGFIYKPCPSSFGFSLES